ncbi:NAD(P)H-binding protein [Gordonia sp. HY442]|uniref:NAD(P)-dependent oxidoreductase n=1 Tax=Gordonia zhenghanii TaxID=2911516 RepID=UPI001F1BB9FD|nr:NAD(P)H-binding protein [Gordonia zhenghanii]MCF8603724.1 NAD(P)H-binding protein [Gordonia zhenghanii]
MQIALVGVSGRTGHRVVDRALADGHVVRASSRSPEDARDFGREGVEWFTGDVRDRAVVVQALVGADVVISALGVGASKDETTAYSRGITTITDAMVSAGIRRLAVVSAAPVGNDMAGGVVSRVMRAILWRFFGASYRDMARMEAQLSQQDDIDWCSLRPPYLKDAPSQGAYRSDNVRLPRGARSITTGDLADALLDAVCGRGNLSGVTYVAN